MSFRFPVELLDNLEKKKINSILNFQKFNYTPLSSHSAAPSDRVMMDDDPFSSWPGVK